MQNHQNNRKFWFLFFCCTVMLFTIIMFLLFWKEIILKLNLDQKYFILLDSYHSSESNHQDFTPTWNGLKIRNNHPKYASNLHNATVIYTSERIWIYFCNVILPIMKLNVHSKWTEWFVFYKLLLFFFVKINWIYFYMISFFNRGRL